MNWGSIEWIIALIVAGIFFCKGLYVGLVPAAIELVGLLLGILLGFITGWLADWIVGPFLPWPPFFTGMGVGFLVALGIFGITSYCAPYIFEFLDEMLTDFILDPSESWVGATFALGGGLLEALIGLILVWSAITILIACGNEAELQIQKSDLPPNWVESTLVKVKNSVQGTSKDEFAKFSAAVTQPVEKLVRISQSPAAMERAKKYPDVQQLMLDPKVSALLANPEVNKDVTKGDSSALMGDPLVESIASDYDVVKDLTSSDFNRELDEILNSPASPPAKK